MKLTSLKDKPATKENVGELIYMIVGTNVVDYTIFEVKECQGKVSTGINEYPDNAEYLYWQKPIIITELKYKEMLELLDRSKGFIKEINEVVNERCKRYYDYIEQETIGASNDTNRNETTD